MRILQNCHIIIREILEKIFYKLVGVSFNYDIVNGIEREKIKCI